MQEVTGSIPVFSTKKALYFVGSMVLFFLLKPIFGGCIASPAPFSGFCRRSLYNPQLLTLHRFQKRMFAARLFSRLLHHPLQCTAYVGFWTDKGKADESSSDFLKQLRGKQVFLFGTAGFGGSEEYFNKILKAVQKDLHSSNTVIGSFMCQGKMPMSVRQRYENMKKQPLHLPNLDAMIENFDKALSHPDADDLERLKQAVK